MSFGNCFQMALTPQLGSCINHSEHICNMTKSLFLNPELADVTFVIHQQRFPAHKLILASRVEYFRIMIYGGFYESARSEIELTVNPDAFKTILEYIYTGCLDMHQYTEEELSEIVYLSTEYCIESLTNAILPPLFNSFNRNNYGAIVNVAHFCSYDKKYPKFLQFLDYHAEFILQQECFELLHTECLIDIVKRCTFAAYELNIFKAVMRWSETHDEEDLERVIPNIRFTLMQVSELNDYVAPTGLLSKETIKSIITDIKERLILPLREGRTHRIQQNYYELKPISVYGDELTFAETLKTKKPIFLMLSKERMINYIYLDLCDHLCSYQVEISTDCRYWKKVIDYGKFNCYSRQFLFFTLTPVRYICILPTYFKNEFYCLAKIQTDYIRTTLPILFDDIVAPLYHARRNCHEDNDSLKYNSHSTMTTITRCMDSLKLTITLCQPLHVNVLKLSCVSMSFKVRRLESALNENNFTRVPFYSYDGRTLHFDGHAITFLSVIFSEPPKPGEFMKLVYYYKVPKGRKPQ